MQGIQGNLELMKRFYPGWVMRLYYETRDELSEDFSQLCSLACSDPWLDLCNVDFNPQFGNVSFIFPMVWRFLPALDSQVKTRF